MTARFEHRHAAHCESGAISALLRHHGADVSEAMAFGLSSALSFAYLPFIRLQGLPLVAYRMPPRAIIKGLSRPFGARFRFETFRSPQAGAQRLDALLDEGRVVGLQTSVFWLPYFPQDMRFHFNAHNLLVFGRNGDQYDISDPVFETPQTCAAADLSRARFAKGLLAPRGMLYYAEGIDRTQPSAEDTLRAIRKTCRGMRAPVPIAGVRAMRMLARKLASLDPTHAATAPFVGHVVRMQEEIGTGGAGFRFIYAAFLQEAAQLTTRSALDEFADRLMRIGDDWRAFALRAARMLRAREPMVPAELARLLHAQADAEEQFFRDLARAC